MMMLAINIKKIHKTTIIYTNFYKTLSLASSRYVNMNILLICST